MHFYKRIYKIFLSQLVLIIFFVAIFLFIFDIGAVTPPGVSMLPLFKPYEKNLILQWWIKINRYDIVVLYEPNKDDRLLIKRVIGVPGDLLEIHQGFVFVNGVKLPEPYLKNLTQRGVENYILRNGSSRINITPEFYFVMGDNRDNSYDSRNFGPVHEKNIQGKIICIFWPPSSFKIF